MGIGSISFWQQDQNYWNQVQQNNAQSSATNSLISAMSSLQANKAKGMASIATQQAIDRTNAQLKAALESAIAQVQGQSASGSGSSTSTTPPTPLAATGTGSVPLTAGTSLITLGIPPTGAITVSDGTNTTTYTSTGTDTVGDLINAINAAGPKNAQVTAYLNSSGKLVVTAQNNTSTISVGGLFASNVGFNANNDSFQPTVPGTSSSSSTGSASSSSSSTTNSTSTSSRQSSTVAPRLFNSAYALQTAGTAATLLSSAGSSSSSSGINLLA